jgi:predicted DNA-binding protein YlxM (UPF0122 family)
MDEKANFAQKKAEIAYRRKLVGGLYLAHISQDEIARQVKCDQSTVSRDIKFLKKEWTKEAVGEIADFVVRELAELNEMERQAALEFGQKGGKTPRWLDVRLRIKEKKYQLLGLDKQVIELTGNVKVQQTIDDVREKRWQSVQKSLAEILFEESGQPVSSYNNKIIGEDDNGNE